MTRYSDPEGKGTCRSCEAMILWVLLLNRNTGKCKPHPVDPVPKPEGNIERKRGNHSSKWYGQIVPKEAREGALYVSHFSTCPNAKQHRRPT